MDIKAVFVIFLLCIAAGIAVIYGVYHPKQLAMLAIGGSPTSEISKITVKNIYAHSCDFEISGAYGTSILSGVMSADGCSLPDYISTTDDNILTIEVAVVSGSEGGGGVVVPPTQT